MRNVQPTPNGNGPSGVSTRRIGWKCQWGGTKADQYRINTETGERTLIEKR